MSVWIIGCVLGTADGISYRVNVVGLTGNELHGVCDLQSDLMDHFACDE